MSGVLPDTVKIPMNGYEKELRIQARRAELAGEKAKWAELELTVLGRNEEEARAALRVLRDEYVSAEEKVSDLQHKLGERKPPVAVRRVDLKPGEALVSNALVRKPSLPGEVESWTLETYGHRGPIAKIAYSPDGSQFASAGHNGTVRIWNAESGLLVRILIDPNGGTVDLPWFADGGDAGRFSWSADGSRPARTIDEILTLWEIALPDMWRPLQRTVAALALSPDRTTLTFGDRDGMIRVLDVKSGQLRHSRLPAWGGPVHSVRFSPDGEVLATCSGPGTICLWDTHGWEPLGNFEADRITGGSASPVSSIAWAPERAAIARANNRQRLVEILDSQSGELLRTLSVGTHDIASVSWSPDGALVVAATEGGPARVWDVASDSNEPLVSLPAHSGRTNAIAWTPEDQSLITAGDDGKIGVWESRSGTRTKSLQGSTTPITCLALSPEGRILAAASDDGLIRLWDAGGGWTSRLLRSEPNDTQAGQPHFTAVCWSPDGECLASGDFIGHVQIWDPNSRQPKRSFRSNCGSISALAWSPDGRVLMCGGSDGTVRAWDAENDFREHVVLLPLWGSVGPGIAVGSAGDYRGPPGIADHLVYVAETTPPNGRSDRAGLGPGQLTLKPADFKSQYGWVNEPWQVGLYKPGAEKVERIYVNAASQGHHDGKTWETAFNDLQVALSAAQSNTEIWVAAGVYTPDRGTAARTASFRLKNGVRLLGGFAGTETSSHQRDPNSNEAVLSGDLKGDDGPGFANNEENSYHVVTTRGTDESAFLDGFIITAGNANGPWEYKPYKGGGICNKGGSPTIMNCILRQNSAVEGGAMYNDHGKPTLVNCTFTGNKANYGGGMSNRHLAKGILINCMLSNNSADGEGGGGIYNFNVRELVLINCRFTGNSTDGSGGGMRSYLESNLTLTNCTFCKNSAEEGGGMYNLGRCRSMLINCTFSANGAVVGYGGGMYTWKACEESFTNCAFIANSAEYSGGAILNQDSRKLALTNCTVMANKAELGGGGIYDVNAPLDLTNCVLWGNTDRGGIDEAAQIDNTRAGITSSVNHCCIQGWTGRLGGAGNFGDDPLFVDPNGPDDRIGTEDDDLRLNLNSPCLNAGDESALPADISDLDGDRDTDEQIPFDIEGKARIHGDSVDLGAYESG